MGMAGKVGRPPGVGKTPGSGRVKGTPNKATRAIKEIAEPYSEAAVGHAGVHYERSGAPHAARVAAANALLDRGHGKPAQAIEAKIEERAAFAVAVLPQTATRDDWMAEVERMRLDEGGLPDLSQ